MSSSDPIDKPADDGAGAFVRAFAVGIAASFALLVALLLVVDPVGAGPGNALCAQGAKTTVGTYAKPLLPGILHPRTVILGTSRVQFGFDSAALATLQVRGPTANLGVPASLPSDWETLGASVLRSATRPVIYLGVDFNSAYQPANAPLDPQPDNAVARAFDRLRGAWFSNQALQSLPDALPLCAIGYHADGTYAREVDAHSPLLGNLYNTAQMREGIRWTYTPGIVNQRLAQIDRLLAGFGRAGARVVVFSAPYRPEAMQAYRQEGLADEFALFHRRLQQIAQANQAAFVDFRSPRAIAELDLAPCPQGGIGCHFYDLSHYRPELGRAMAPALRRAARSAQ